MKDDTRPDPEDRTNEPLAEITGSHPRQTTPGEGDDTSLFDSVLIDIGGGTTDAEPMREEDPRHPRHYQYLADRRRRDQSLADHLNGLPEDARERIREAVQRVVKE
jgi:hypothetical protein